MARSAPRRSDSTPAASTRVKAVVSIAGDKAFMPRTWVSSGTRPWLGIQGNADDDPHDTTTTVGELTHYVWQQWAEHASDVRMSGGYQQLVEERGSVHTDEVFWRLTGAGSARGSGAAQARPRASAK